MIEAFYFIFDPYKAPADYAPGAKNTVITFVEESFVPL